MTERRIFRRAAAALGLVAGCGVTPWPGRQGRYATPIGTAPVTDNATPYTEALTCLAGHLGPDRPVIAVGTIGDDTGKYSDLGGNRVTQGAALMAISAVARLDLPLVERLDIAPAERELKLANTNLIGEAGGVRAIRPGSIPGSGLFLVGGVTELNYTIRSVAADACYSSGGLGGRLYVMNIALDLRLVETETAVGDMARRLFGLDPGTCGSSPNGEDGSSPSSTQGRESTKPILMATTAVALLAAPALAQEIGEIEATVSEKTQPVLSGRRGRCASHLTATSHDRPRSRAPDRIRPRSGHSLRRPARAAALTAGRAGLTSHVTAAPRPSAPIICKSGGSGRAAKP